ncbi:MAG: hypothetical protein IT557_06140 [Alphaproteobacteria bacterium]|nr:hypothetical protein [Alphaproteobacteria bacterium]
MRFVVDIVGDQILDEISHAESDRAQHPECGVDAGDEGHDEIDERRRLDMP